MRDRSHVAPGPFGAREDSLERMSSRKSKIEPKIEKGLMSLEVEREPSYEGLKFRSRGLLLTNFPGRFLRPKFMSTSVSRSCHVFFQVALIELYPGEKSGTRRDDI